MLRTHRLSSRSTARNAPKAAESAPRQPARWLTCTRTRGPCPWLIIGIGIGAGIGIGMGVGNSCGSQDHPQALLIACAASSHTVESDVSRRARTRATRAESGRAAGGCCTASAFAAKRNISGQRGMDDLDGKDRKSTRLNSSHSQISYAVFCLKKKKHNTDKLFIRQILAQPRLWRYILQSGTYYLPLFLSRCV